MAEELKLNAAYPGLPGLIEASYTLSLGITPGTLSLTLQADLGDIGGTGDFAFSDGVRTVTIPKCRIEKVIGNASISNATWTVLLSDRRWEWEYKRISGRYNVPAAVVVDIPKLPAPNTQPGNPPQPDPDDPQVQEWSKKSARELATLCLTAMGESGYDASAVPDDQFPYVDWIAANAAGALQSLCDPYGCRVVYRPDSDTVLIAKSGEGAELPDLQPGDLSEDNLSLDPPEPPTYIEVYGAPTRYQGRFKLGARGRDFDNLLKKFDDLSYKPRIDWSTVPVPTPFGNNSYFSSLPDGRSFHDVNSAANASMYRVYEIEYTLPATAGDDSAAINALRIPFDSTTTTDDRKLYDVTLTPLTVETSIDDTGDRSFLPARVYGRAKRGQITFKESQLGDEVKIGFDVDRQHITFQTFAYYTEKDTANNKTLIHPADLILETACHVADPVTHALARWRAVFDIQTGEQVDYDPQPADNVLAIVREDIRYFVKANYASTTDHTITSTTDNAAECAAQARYYAQAEAARYKFETPRTRTYNGIFPIYCDGAIQQVSWSIGVGGVSTTASRNTEHSMVVPPYPNRRRNEQTSLEALRRNGDSLARMRMREMFGDT